MMNRRIEPPTAVCGDGQSGLIRLERTADHLWQTGNWSAFVVWLVLPENSCRLSLENGSVLAELTSNSVFILSCRLEVVIRSQDTILLVPPAHLPVCESAYVYWKKHLPAGH